MAQIKADTGRLSKVKAEAKAEAKTKTEDIQHLLSTSTPNKKQRTKNTKQRTQNTEQRTQNTEQRTQNTEQKTTNKKHSQCNQLSIFLQIISNASTPLPAINNGIERAKL